MSMYMSTVDWRCVECGVCCLLLWVCIITSKQKKKNQKKKRTDDVFGCFSFQKEERKKIGKLSELKF